MKISDVNIIAEFFGARSAKPILFGSSPEILIVENRILVETFINDNPNKFYTFEVFKRQELLIDLINKKLGQC